MASASTPANSIFFWCGPGVRSGQRVNYQQFVLNGNTFNIGDCVYLFPEDEGQPHYLGRIRFAFIDEASDQTPKPHNIEIKWFERRVNLEQATKGIEESEKEVFELEDTDINPIGCISGKCFIIRAASYEEAQQSAVGVDRDWFFCRGFFLQASNSFRPYTPAELAIKDGLQAQAAPALMIPAAEPVPATPFLLASSSWEIASAAATAALMSSLPAPSPLDMPPMSPLQPDLMLPPAQQLQQAVAAVQAQHIPRQVHSPLGSSRGWAEEAEEEDEEEEEGRQGKPISASKQPPAKRKATGRVCVECGATTTPQWREGPAGPKTLCNACGVRHVRAQQRANKRPAKSGGAGRTGSAGSPSTAAASGRGKAKVASSSDAEQARVPEQSTRPVRQAALASLNRTAVFARTGEFPDEDEPSAAAGAARRGGGGRFVSASSYDSAAHRGSGDSEDEGQRALGGGRGAGRGRSGSRLGSPVSQRQRSGPAAAAVSLMALSSVASGELAVHNLQHHQQGLQVQAPAPVLLPQQHTGPRGLSSSVLPPGRATAGCDASTLLAANLWAPAAAAASSSMQQDPGIAASTGWEPAASPRTAAAAAAATALLPSSPSNGHPNGRAAAAAPSATTSSRPPHPLTGSSTLTTAPRTSKSLPKEGHSLSTSTSGNEQQKQQQHVLPVQLFLPVPAVSAAAMAATVSAAGAKGRGPPLDSAMMQQQQSSVGLRQPSTLDGTLQAPSCGSPPSVSQGEFAALLVHMCQHQPELEAYAQAFFEAERSGTQLPKSLMQRLAGVKQHVDVAAREAAMAEAEVQAVEQVFSVRQEAAERAREAAAQAGLKLKEYMASLAMGTQLWTAGGSPSDMFSEPGSSLLEDAAVYAALGALTAVATLPASLPGGHDGTPPGYSTGSGGIKAEEGSLTVDVFFSHAGAVLSSALASTPASSGAAESLLAMCKQPAGLADDAAGAGPSASPGKEEVLQLCERSSNGGRTGGRPASVGAGEASLAACACVHADVASADLSPRQDIILSRPHGVCTQGSLGLCSSSSEGRKGHLSAALSPSASPHRQLPLNPKLASPSGLCVGRD